MKLELKHLAPYFPYGLEAIDKNGLKHPVLMLFEDRLLTDESFIYNLKYAEIKPILRPLSDLTKEIEHNGEKFVPIEWLGDHLQHLQPYRDDHSPQLFYEWIESKINDEDALGDVAYSIVEKLFEWNFDVFGLIPAGLALKK